jgi:hypothetical protein
MLALHITVADICSFNTKFNKMEESKNLEQNLDNSNEKLHISDVSKRSQLRFEISQLLYQVNSRYGMEGEFPTDEQRMMMYNKIAELRKQLLNVC